LYVTKTHELIAYGKTFYFTDHPNGHAIFAWRCGYFWVVNVVQMLLWIVNKTSLLGLYMWLVIKLLEKYLVEHKMEIQCNLV